MPVLSRGTIRIDYTDEGQGQPVIAIHSSVSANRQWRTLTETLRDRYRVLAVNLFGYGETTPWPGTSPQSLYAQAVRAPKSPSDEMSADAAGIIVI
jgi:pimeloyl-ACP methyl ester carboxylesterase